MPPLLPFTGFTGRDPERGAPGVSGVAPVGGPQPQKGKEVGCAGDPVRSGAPQLHGSCWIHVWKLHRPRPPEALWASGGS